MLQLLLLHQEVLHEQAVHQQEQQLILIEQLEQVTDLQLIHVLIINHGVEVLLQVQLVKFMSLDLDILVELIQMECILQQH